MAFMLGINGSTLGTFHYNIFFCQKGHIKSEGGKEFLHHVRLLSFF